ncbi:MAG: S-layer homology domain-containing protein [Oscillospiraceae bacterium]|nr:S-layer homology domain-containing protein [Oscillospiraceae bacterium]
MKKKVLSLLLVLAMVLSLAPVGVLAGVDPFCTSVGSITAVEKNGYTFTEWDGTELKLDLYTVTVPFGTQSVTLNFNEERIAYGYDESGVYVSSCGSAGDGSYADNGQTGQTAALVRADADGSLPAYVHVQTPYDSNWSSTTLYAVRFEYTHLFSAFVNGEAMTEVSCEPNAYSYYDYMSGQTTRVAVYTVTVPAGTGTVDLEFSDNILAYNYTKDGEYLCGYYDGDTMYTGSLTASVPVDCGTESDPADGEPDYIQIQTPYDNDWNSTLLYAVTFAYDGGSDDNTDIQKVYAETKAYLAAAAEKDPAGVSDWAALGLARDGVKLDDAYYNAVCAYVAENINDKGQLSSRLSTENSRRILALTALGRDVTNVAGHDLLTGLSDLSYVTRQGLNGAVYALLALDCGGYDVPEGGTATREALINAILDKALPAGGWAYSGTEADPDMTAVAIQALAPYYGGNESVKSAVDKALEGLSAMQTENGGFISSGSENCESSAQVIIALTALGIDPEKDARFVKNGKSALDALCSYAVDGGGFKHIAADAAPDAVATQQGYCALVAYQRFKNGSCRLYDMSDVEILPADPFTDIAESGYYKYIVGAADAGIIAGYPDGSYRPNNTVTRAQFITMLYRAAGSPEVKNTALEFADSGTIAKDYVAAVAWGVENKVISGYGDNSFRPNRNISRAQMATFMYRYMKNVVGYDFGEAEPCGFDDYDEIAAPYVDAVNAIVSAGVMNGMNAATFAPNGTANRGMAATVMLRVYELAA